MHHSNIIPKTPRFLLVAAMFLPLLSSCELEMSGNGKLDGYWHYETIDTLQTGGICDMSTQKKFLSVQSKLLQIEDRTTGQQYIFNFSHEGDSLTLWEPRVNNREEGDPLVEDATALAPFGLQALRQQFYIEKMSGSKMILRSNALRINLRKF